MATWIEVTKDTHAEFFGFNTVAVYLAFDGQYTMSVTVDAWQTGDYVQTEVFVGSRTEWYLPRELRKKTSAEEAKRLCELKLQELQARDSFNGALLLGEMI
jgi:hypothetical protein